MDAEAGNRGAEPKVWDSKVLQFHRIPGLRNASAGSRADGNAPGDGSAVEFGKQGLVPRKQITVIRTGFRPQPAALEKPCDAPANTFREPGDVCVTRRHGVSECELPFVIHCIDPVERERVEENIEIQGIPEALDK